MQSNQLCFYFMCVNHEASSTFISAQKETLLLRLEVLQHDGASDQLVNKVALFSLGTCDGLLTCPGCQTVLTQCMLGEDPAPLNLNRRTIGLE